MRINLKAIGLQVQSRPQSAATEKSLPVSTPPQTPSQSQVAVEIHSSEPPAWPAPGGEAVSAPTEGDRGVTREAHQDARSSLDRQEAASGGGSAPQNDTVKTVFETEASTMASGPAALENKKTPDGLSVRKPSGEVRLPLERRITVLSQDAKVFSAFPWHKNSSTLSPPRMTLTCHGTQWSLWAGV